MTTALAEPLIAPVALPRRSVGSRTRALEAGAAAALVLSAAGLGSLFGLLSGSNPQPSRSASGAAIVVAFDDTANSLRATSLATGVEQALSLPLASTAVTET